MEKYTFRPVARAGPGKERLTILKNLQPVRSPRGNPIRRPSAAPWPQAGRKKRTCRGTCTLKTKPACSAPYLCPVAAVRAPFRTGRTGAGTRGDPRFTPKKIRRMLMDEKKKKIWALVLKVLVAALTALTGALTSCALLP